MTLCSGIGAPEVAAPWVDWRFASEIEAFPREVLIHRHGYRPPEDHRQGDPYLHGDMTKVSPELLRSRGVPLPDIIVAGTPCQSFSVAGLRKGLDDDRGNLTLQFVRICHDITAARPDGKLAVLWENVVGVLSDRGNAFGAFLGGLVGADDALRSPGDGSWPGEGMVQGPRARAAWAVLDAQWFGVAQRRRRVFVVVDFGGACDPAAVLLEPDSLRGDSPPRREAGQGVAPSLAARTRGGGGLGTDFEVDGGLIAADVAPTINAHFGDKLGLENQHVDGGGGMFVAHTLRGEGFDASEDGTGRGTPLVPVAIQERAVSENPDNGPGGKGWQEGVAFTIEARNKVQAVAFDLAQITSAMNRTKAEPGLPASTLSAQSAMHVATDWAVRRLTPRECERLQGFPDDFTLIPRGKKRPLKDIDDELAYLRRTYPDMTANDALRLASDGPRYKALGNSMAVPVIRWIMDRMRLSMEVA